jgi:hypothetical protein
MSACSRRTGLRIVFVAILVVCTEFAAYLGLELGAGWFGNIRRVGSIYEEQTKYITMLAMGSGDARREVIDPVLGWRYRPDYQRGDDVINSQGLRSKHAYSKSPHARTLRIAAFGDSFVYGNEVGTADSWPSLMEESCERLEVLNYGVGGYGVDQALLRFESEGMEYEPEIVLMGFVTDDLRRLVNRYRRFIADQELPYFKPRFVLEGTDLRLIKNPIPASSDYSRLIREPSLVTQVGWLDHWYSPMIYENPFYDISSTVRLATTVGLRIYRRFVDPDRIWDGQRINAESEAFRLQVVLFQRFVDAARKQAAKPHVIIFPSKEDLLLAWNGEKPSYSPLVDELNRLNLPHFDLVYAFPPELGRSIEDLFRPEGHYSRKGNEWVAKHLLQHLTAGACNGKVGMVLN